MKHSETHRGGTFASEPLQIPQKAVGKRNRVRIVHWGFVSSISTGCSAFIQHSVKGEDVCKSDILCIDSDMVHPWCDTCLTRKEDAKIPMEWHSKHLKHRCQMPAWMLQFRSFGQAFKMQIPPKNNTSNLELLRSYLEPSAASFILIPWRFGLMTSD